MFDNLFSNKDLIHKAEWLDILAMHAGIGVWDAIFYEGDFMHPKARWTFSSEFRRLCGFTTASEFPDVMQSWSERLHPDDAEAIFATFSSACASGVSYDVKYRLKVKNGTYRWFRATGGVVLDEQRKPRRACGSLVDIDDAEKFAVERATILAKMADDFESAIGAIVSTVSSASGELEISAGTLAMSAERSRSLATAVASASAEASNNVQSVA